ncbi:MAG: xanthine dehydrogenase family protein molybdopterin-binding subunit [Dehalococcoidia bacterium]|nr:xanthine dehydrogenase family protein molybdopterin-binding subunit [Dehalococcoidia bacterium]MDP6228505.1 xanthine dehydrogenase family protein molybdopterin-binding subunit [Dehalococcoidia bacterium]MDP7200051.1 xanthine dehydrogenase family protein molybdopterin-binding subunit [Dehalococcoidia bacterium]MDP7512083.1 xanthine dehydrogenase family protein molybdopterin-binding subunit [Dehalococcoidia bacterium]
MASNVVLSQVEYRVVGKRVPRPDGVDKVTGRAQFGADINLAGLLHGKVLRSPHAHAKIKSIDTSRAEAYPGVKAVVTARDLPLASLTREQLGGEYQKLKIASDLVLASDRVLFKGQGVAAVAATNPHVAGEAVKLIEVEYEELHPLLDVLAAMEEGAPLLHEDLYTSFMGETSEQCSNIAAHLSFEKGDAERGFAEAEVVVEREFRTAWVHQGYIEPQASTACWNADGQLAIWSSTQGAFGVRAEVAGVLRHSVSKIKVTPMEVGGGFGGKLPAFLESLATLLSRKTGQPVKLVMTRTEVFESSSPASGSWVKVKMGAAKNGRLTAIQLTLAYEAGAYPGAPISQGIGAGVACYDVPNALADGYDVVVNKPKSGAYRAPGGPQANFAVESVADELCQKLGMDPIEFRLINASKEGTRRIEGPVIRRVGLVECLEAARNHDHYRTPLTGKNRGRGVACGFWHNRGFVSSCHVTVNPDGSVGVASGSVDLSGTRVTIAQQTAEALGIDYEDVRPAVVDTDSIAFTFVTGGSRTTFATGLAAINAAEEVKQQMVERAARIWEASAEDVEYVDGVISHKSDSKLRFTFRELAGRLLSTGGAITGKCNIDPSGEGNAFSVHLVDVEVDPETGKTNILRYTAIQDVGKAVHPSFVEGQMQGGVAQGIGWALNEEYFFNDRGQMMNPSFLDYRMPTTLDLPWIDTVIVEVANAGHPYGVRGVGENAIVAPPAAVANAVSHATGVRMNSLPLSPGKILEALGG